MEDRQWGDTGMRCFGMLLDGRAQKSGIRRPGNEATLMIVINDHDDLVDFIIPEAVGGDSWSLLIDTTFEDRAASGTFKTGAKYGVTGRSVLLLLLRAEGRNSQHASP